jgi:hypothetical protein
MGNLIMVTRAQLVTLATLAVYGMTGPEVVVQDFKDASNSTLRPNAPRPALREPGPYWRRFERKRRPR